VKTNESELTAIADILRTQGKVKLYTAIPVIFLLILYFFSFATLLDKAPLLFFMIEMVTGVIFVFVLIFLNKLSFKWTLRKYRHREPHGNIIVYMTADDVDKKPERLMVTIDKLRAGQQG